MALLNWGNALSQAGKGLATVGLEGVKATLEQDKIRLAAKLAEEATIRGEERKWTAEQTQQPIRATWALDAVKNAKQAEIDLATDPTNIDKITKAKTLELTALDNFQTTLDKQHANDPKWVAAQKVKYDALNPYASAEAAYKNIQTNAATLKYDTDKSIKDLTGKIATETDPVIKQTLIAERDAKAWSIEGDRAERIANRQERAGIGTYIASQQTELARLKQAGAPDNDPDVEAIRSSLPGFQSLYKRLTEEAYPKDKVSPVPAPVAAPGSAATPGKAATPTIVEAPTPVGGLLTTMGETVTTMGENVTREGLKQREPTVKSMAEKINAAVAKGPDETGKLTLPHGYMDTFELGLTSYKDKNFFSPAAKALYQQLKTEADEAAAAKDDKKKPVPANNGKTVVRGVTIRPVN